MENVKKLDFFSFLSSLLIHIVFLLAFSATKAFLPKTYQVVNTVPLSFDMEVESELVGEKSVKGNTHGGEENQGSSLTFGSFSKTSKGLQGGKSAEDRKKGVSESEYAFNKGAGSSPSKFAQSGTQGNGNGYLKLSAEFPKKGKGRPSIKSSRLVPYLLKVKNRIMENWKIPYYRSGSGKRKVVVVLTLKSDGTVNELSIKELSPDIIFNRSAISAVYSVKKFDPFPKGLNFKTLRVKVNFEVE